MRLSMKSLFVLGSLSAALTQIVYAADATTNSGSTSADTGLLQQIADNTYNMLSAVNNIPTYLGTVDQMATSWLATDDDPSTSFITQTQADFASLGYWLEQNKVTQDSMQAQVMASVTHQPLATFTTPENNPGILAKIPNINDLSYSTVVNQPVVARGGATPFNYIVNAAGLSAFHAAPSFSWPGNPTDISRYTNYYNTVMAIESFNAYALSSLVADNQNGNQVKALQTSLTNQATSSSWLAEIATEDLGKVLRQILLFESQAYVLQLQSLQVQKQVVTAQTMTNTLLIMGNYENETQMARKAQGLQPKG